MSTASSRTETASASRSRNLASHVPPDDGDSPVRRAGQRPLHARVDARTRASLHRRGSGGRGSLRGAAARRLHHQHAPRPRTLPGEGRVARSHVRRAARQGSRILPGQGRIDAHRRSRHRQPGRERDRRRQRGHRDGRGVFCEASRQRARGGVLLRRRRAGPGRAVRSDEPGAALEVAGDLRLRKQSLQRIHALFRNHGGRHSGTGRRRSGCAAESVDGQDVRAVYQAAARLVERARGGEGPAFLLCNTYRYRGHHVGDINREYYRAKQEEQDWKTERDPIKLLRRLADRAEASPTPRNSSESMPK